MATTYDGAHLNSIGFKTISLGGEGCGDFLDYILAGQEDVQDVLNGRNSEGQTPLMVAIRRLRVGSSAVDYLFGRPEVDVHAKCHRGRTALSHASFDTMGTLRYVKKMVEGLGADVTMRHNTGSTLVKLAASRGRMEILTYLFGRCFRGMIDLEAKGEHGHTALTLACG